MGVDINRGDSNKARNEDEGMGIAYKSLSKNGFNEEESKDSSKSSLKSKVENNDKDIRGLSIKIIDINNNISDFLL